LFQQCRNHETFPPIKALIKLDFPALGRPTTAKRGKTTSSELVLVLPETHQLMHPTNHLFHFQKYWQKYNISPKPRL
jgi:hypothetical protein